MHLRIPNTLCLISILFAASVIQAAPRNRVVGAIDENQRVFLKGNVHGKARVQDDQGPVSPALQLTHVTIALKPSDSQQAELDKLLSAQQDPASADYHRWLTPEEYGTRFGLSDADLAKISDWLTGQGLTVTATARARNYITFDGIAQNVEKAFAIQLDNYLVDGEIHFANSSEPSIPAALQPVVLSIQGLHDFRMKARAKLDSVSPKYTSATSGNHYLAPDDIATIYNIRPLLNAGIDGTGQKIVVVGQTGINLSDLQQFRSFFNLPALDPQIIEVPNTRNPGIRNADLGEADLDLEWSAAIARNATIIYVYGSGVSQAWQYAVDQNLAPIMSSSYGACEPDSGSSYAASLRAIAQQANAQGITWFNASGDSGGADCSGGNSLNNGLAVDLPAAVPEVTAIGGTTLVEGTGTYWNPTNDANRASALSYIPETAWNDSVADGSPSATGGGASIFFAKPAWQTGPGIPSDGARDVPDVSLAASVDHDGYLMYSSGSLSAVGGTSVPTPVFAGIAALLNQYLIQNGVQSVAGLGNMNPKLYSLAQAAPSVFHDITTGDNLVAPTCGRRICSTTPAPVGYSAAPGYDQTTGLGSVDVYNLVTSWNTVDSRLAPKLSLVSSANNLSASSSTTVTVTVTSSTSVTPTGSVTFFLGATTLGTAPLTGTGSTATASLNVLASQLAPGTVAISAQYNSDNATFANASGSITVTVAGVGPVTISAVADGASFQHAYAPGAVLSVFGTQLASTLQLAASVPLPLSMSGVSATINGVAAPLYAISPGQLNIQIPYETPVNSTATLIILNNGLVATYSFPVVATAPAIFTDSSGAPVPSTSARGGDIVTLFVTGAGAMTPYIATGAAPAAGTAVTNLPHPVNQPVSVAVGGLTAPVQFAGIPAGLAGVMQINYQVPSGLNTGLHPVVVTIGAASSAQAKLTIIQ